MESPYSKWGSEGCLFVDTLRGVSHSTLTCSLLKITYGQEYISDKSNEWGDVVYSRRRYLFYFFSYLVAFAVQISFCM